MSTIQKADLIKQVANKTGNSIKDCEVIINSFLENLTNSVTLDSITPDALHQNIAYLRDPASFQKPELSSVIETLYAAKYLELGALHYLIFFNYFLLLVAYK